MLGKKRRYNHSHAVVHEAGLPELTHARINNRIASLTLLPCGQVSDAVVPGKGCELTFEWGVWHVVKEVNELVTELTPANLSQKFVDSRAPMRRRELPLLCSRPDLTRGYLTEFEMGGEPRCVSLCWLIPTF